MTHIFLVAMDWHNTMRCPPPSLTCDASGKGSMTDLIFWPDSLIQDRCLPLIQLCWYTAYQMSSMSQRPARIRGHIWKSRWGMTVRCGSPSWCLTNRPVRLACASASGMHRSSTGPMSVLWAPSVHHQSSKLFRWWLEMAPAFPICGLILLSLHKQPVWQSVTIWASIPEADWDQVCVFTRAFPT